MIVYLSSPVGVRDSLGHSISSNSPLSNTLDWLLYSASTSHTSSELRAFWDLDSAVRSLLPLLPASARETLSKTNRVVWGSYRLFYIPGKLFVVNKSHDEVTFYDLSQYFPDDSCSTIQQVREKADSLLQTLSDLGIPSPSRLTSPIALVENDDPVKAYLADVPTIFHAPDAVLEAYEWASWCTPREWVSAYQVGHWGQDELWDYDLSSAYPYAASQLVDLRDCQFRRVGPADADKIESAYYGILYGDLYLDPSHPHAFCSPVVVDLDGKPSCPVGHLPVDYYTLDTIRFVYSHGLGRFTLRSGWLISPFTAVRPRLPFRDLMSRLYSLRARSDLASYFVKRVMTGIVGRLLETHKKDGAISEYGRLYNPIYHAIITSQTRVRVAEFVIQNGITESELVHVGVDGIKAAKRLSFPIEAKKLGQWVCRGSEPVFVLSPGRIYTPSRPKGGVTYHLLQASLDAHPNVRRYEFNGSELDLSVLQFDLTRGFPTLPRTGKALLESRFGSKPIVL